MAFTALHGMELTEPAHLGPVDDWLWKEPTPIYEVSEELQLISSAMRGITHTRINGESYDVNDLPATFGFTHEELFSARLNKLATATFCMLEGVPVSLDEFSRRHEKITLGQE